jgi:LPXTG-motif cell wall-anchored protein
MSDATGMFNIALNQPLAEGDCIYVFDTCTGLVGPVACAFGPAPAPTLSPRLLLLAIGVLSAIAGLGLRRRRRDA